MIKKCKYCSKEFKTNREWQKFCPGGVCRKAYWKEIYSNRQSLHKRLEALEEKLEKKGGSQWKRKKNDAKTGNF